MCRLKMTNTVIRCCTAFSSCPRLWYLSVKFPRRAVSFLPLNALCPAQHLTQDANNKGGREGADAIKHTSPRGTSEGGNSKGKRLILSLLLYSHQFSSAAQLCPTPRTAARQASQSITKSRSLPKLMSIELVMPSNNLILCRPLLLLLQSFPASGSFPMSQLSDSGV